MYNIYVYIYVYNTHTYNIALPSLFSRLRSFQMHYESEITLEYSTHTYECIKGTRGDIDFFSIL